MKLQEYYRRHAASLLFRRVSPINLERPLISFTFDDFPQSAWTVGGAILEEFGVRGTYYASLGLLGEETPSGKIVSAEDLPHLLQRGHELGCHTFAHCDSWDTSAAAFEQSIIDNCKALNRLLPGATFESFSYPISLPRPLTKAKMAAHFLSCRGGGQTFNVGKADLNQLSAYFLEKSRGDLATVRDLIDRNAQARGWLIFATHDISPQPTPFGCTPEFFAQVVQYAIECGAQVVPVIDALRALGVPGSERRTARRNLASSATASATPTTVSRPLVSILIPAYNAEDWIADTLRSALAQTWEPKEIIVVDDGSTDQTLAVARQFERLGVRVVTQENQGAAAARNHAFSLSQGEYLQWLDADDLLAPDKIASQMAVLEHTGNKRLAMSGPFGKFQYRWYRAQFAPSELWEDLSPTEWLLRKMAQNLYMQTATWLVSRELSHAAGQWDTSMLSDDDGEYFCRILLHSDGVRFVPEAKVYYRAFGYDGLAYVGASDKKREALWRSMQLHIGYLRTLEDSQRSRAACVTYLQRNLIHFYPDKLAIVKQAEQSALDLGGRLRPPHLSWKYSWIKTAFGWMLAKNASRVLRKLRWSFAKIWDRTLFRLEKGRDIEKNWDTPALAPPSQ